MITKTNSYAEVLGSLNNVLWEFQWARQKAKNRPSSLCLQEIEIGDKSFLCYIINLNIPLSIPENSVENVLDDQEDQHS